uniref:Uncharacterized protein n=1 Tax=Timema poppense TaxID=170557 RepID=A0A7R9DLQ3_TIMPO|nr:unnamed protein product [Timema poppensis]
MVPWVMQYLHFSEQILQILKRLPLLRTKLPLGLFLQQSKQWQFPLHQLFHISPVLPNDDQKRLHPRPIPMNRVNRAPLPSSPNHPLVCVGSGDKPASENSRLLVFDDYYRYQTSLTTILNPPRWRSWLTRSSCRARLPRTGRSRFESRSGVIETP